MQEQKFQQMSAYKQRLKKAEYRRLLDEQWEEKAYIQEQEVQDWFKRKKSSYAIFSVLRVFWESWTAWNRQVDHFL